MYKCQPVIINSRTSDYDKTFVRKDTEWVLHRDISKPIEHLVYTYDASEQLTKPEKSEHTIVNKAPTMKDTYEYLKCKFPGWSHPYNELFPQNSIAKSEAALEHSIVEEPEHKTSRDEKLPLLPKHKSDDKENTTCI